MTAHKHAEMIKAKVDNMDLVVFEKSKLSGWIELARYCFPDDEGIDYFLCLPQHKEAVINSLNVGKSEVNYLDIWSLCNCNEPVEWSASWWYMDNNCKSRIKPRKEKRWIAVNNSGYATPMTFISKQECESYVSVSYQKCPGVTWQSIEIEVEV